MSVTTDNKTAPILPLVQDDCKSVDNGSPASRVISIRRKIVAGFAVLIILLMISLIVVMVEMEEIESSATSVIYERQPVAVRFVRFSENLNLAVSYLNGYLLTGHVNNKNQFYDISQKLKAELASFSELARSKHVRIDEKKLSKFIVHMKIFFADAGKLIKLRETPFDNYSGLKLASEKLMPMASSYLASANSLMSDLVDASPTKNNYKTLVLLSELRSSWQQIISSMRLFLNSRVVENIGNIELYLELNQQQFQAFKKAAPNIGFGEIEDMERYSKQWRANWKKVVKLYTSEQWRLDTFLMRTVVRPEVEELRVILLDLSNEQVEGSKQEGYRLTESIGSVKIYSSALMALILMLCIALTIIISRAILPPITSLMYAARRVAKGNLSTKITIVKHDEMGELSESFNSMMNALRIAEEDKQKHIQEMQVWNQDLEKRVEQKVVELKSAQGQLLQSEKLASIGQLAAGVAHEINNPVGYISSNVSTMKKYIEDLFRVLDAYESLESIMGKNADLEGLNGIKEEVELDYLKQDVYELIAESQEGVTRVRQIVQDLKDFSHVDEAEWQWTDLHKGIDSTLNVAHNEIKYKAEVVKEYGDLPQVQCMPSQVNQVFMNLVVNAAHAIEEKGVITIRSGQDPDTVWISVSDNGKGIPDDIRQKIFEPFFTTKPVGSGTGLGLSLSYGIIEKHGGELTVASEVGVGTTFTIVLPIEQKQDMAAETDKDMGSAA